MARVTTTLARSAILASVFCAAAGLPFASQPDAPPTDPLKQGTTHAAVVAPGQEQVWLVELAAGEYAALRVEHETGDLNLVLEDDAGTTRKGAESGSPHESRCSPERPLFDWVADAPGIWRVVVRTYGEEPTPYTVRMPVHRRATSAELLDSDLDALIAAGEFEAALDKADASIAAHVEALPDDPLELADYLEGLCLRLLGYVPDEPVASMLEQVLGLRERALGQDDLCYAETLSFMSVLRDNMEEFETSFLLEKRALAIRERRLGPEAIEVLRSLQEIALLMLRQARYAEAEPYIERVVEITDADDPFNLARSHHLLGEFQRLTNDYAGARSNLEQALGFLSQSGSGDLLLQADLNNSLATLLMDLGDYGEAEIRARENVTLLEKIEDHEGLANGLMTLAEICRRQGRLDDAEQLYRESLDLAEQVFADSSRMIFHRKGLARVYEDAGRYEEARALYEASLEPWIPGAEHLYAENLGDLAGLLRVRGEYAEAERYYRRALALQETVFGPEHAELAITLTELAGTLSEGQSDRADDARALLRRALKILRGGAAHPETAADAYALDARLLEREGKQDEAIAALATALEIVERQRPRTGGAERGLAEFLARYLSYFDDMISWQIERNAPAVALDYFERSRARVLLDQLAAADVDLRQGIDDGKLRSLESAENRARARLAELHTRLGRLRSGIGTATEERTTELLLLEQKKDEAERELRWVWEEIRNESPLWRDTVTSGGQPATLAELRQVIPPNGLLLVYQIGHERSHLLTIDPNGGIDVHLLEIPAGTRRARAAGPLTRDRLAAILTGSPDTGPGGRPGALGSRGIGGMTSKPAARTTGLVDALSVPTPAARQADLSTRLHDLFRILLPEEARARVQRADEIVVVPGGALHLLPFEALVVEPGASWESTTFWLDTGPAVRYAPSATFLHNVESRAGNGMDRGRPDVLSVSDPIYDPAEVTRVASAATTQESGKPSLPPSRTGARLQRLPATAKETRAILEAFDNGSEKRRVQVLQRRNATEPRVRQAVTGKRYIHLATHGFTDPGTSGLFAGLAFTPSPGASADSAADGFLQLFEIYELGLDAELVALSACQSNVGRLVQGEGAFVLARGFFAAGSRRVIATLWSVADESTARLIGDFFGRLAKAEGAGAPLVYSELLAQAKLELREDGTHADPFHWAPFTLSGAR